MKCATIYFYPMDDTTPYGPNLFFSNIHYLPADACLRGNIRQNIPAHDYAYVPLWEKIDRTMMHEAIADYSVFLGQKEYARQVCAALEKEGVRHALLCLCADMQGRNMYLDNNACQWLRNISREIRRIAGKKYPVVHQPATLDELHYTARLESIACLDVSRVWHAALTPERAFRAASSSLLLGKPALFMLDKKLPQDIAKAAQWKHTLRKIMWCAYIGGIAGVVTRESTGLRQILKHRERIGKLESLFEKPLGECGGARSFCPQLVKAGKYHVRKIGENEYLAYSPYGGRITFDCSKFKLPVLIRWYNPETGKFYRNDISFWNRDLTLKAPFAGDAAMYVREE